MEVGVLSGIATTQNADTDEGAEAQMSLSLRQNFYSEMLSLVYQMLVSCKNVCIAAE